MSSPQIITLFCVVFGSPPAEVFSVNVPENANVGDLKELIKDKVKPDFDALAAIKLRLFNVDLSDFEDLELGDFKHEISNAVQDKPLPSTRKMGKIFPLESHQANNLHIVVRVPHITYNTIVNNLISAHETLFKLLQVRVSELGSWSDDDIQNNLGEGEMFGPDDVQRLPRFLAEIEEKLAQTRTYAEPPRNARGGPGFHIARDPEYAPLFEKIYSAGTSSDVSVENDREFIAFFNVLESFQKDSDKIKLDESFSLKASHLTVRFIVPPFFSCGFEEFEYKQQRSLGFPIFLVEDESNVLCRYTPTPDFMVADAGCNCPLLTSEVVSETSKSDTERMLLQAIAFARAGQHLINAREQFYVVAIYLSHEMIVSRYVVAQPKGESNKVFISQKDFNLCRPSESVSFFGEMFNLASMFKELAGKFKPSQTGALKDIHEIAGRLPSLTEIKEKKKGNTFFGGVLGPLAGTKASGPHDDPGIFGADDIQAILKEMRYKIRFIPFGHPMVAVVSNVIDNSKAGFLKFVQDGQKEIPILQYLAGIDSPQNHTVPGVRFWPVRGGQVISMPSAGSWLTSLRNPDAQLWSVARQLFEAVDFMHQHGVAHLDLKPANLLIPPNGGRLSIIDFNTSVLVDSVRTMSSGVVGTPGYIPPEVAADHGLFSAVRADLWSSGKTLSELCNLCLPSVDRSVLLQIAQALMDEDPGKRPMMSDALGRMSSFKNGDMIGGLAWAS